MRRFRTRLVGVGVLLVPVWVGAQTANFDSAVTTGTDGRPSAIAIADMDKEGHLDVITANSDSASITLLTGDGMGNVFSYPKFNAGTVPMGLAIADMDGDHNPDVVVSNANVSTVSVLKRFSDPCPNGDPVCFHYYCTGDTSRECEPSMDSSSLDECELDSLGTCSPLTFVLGGVCTGDFSRRCNPQLAAEMDECHLAGVGMCNTIAGPGAVAAADLDGDGHIDVAVASEGNGDGDGKISVLFGNGDGTFSRITTRAAGSKTNGVVIGDFNGDTKPDVVAINSASQTVSVFFGDGHGNFMPRIDTSVGTAPAAAAGGDVNEDTRRDLIIAVPTGLVVLLGDGQGHFTVGPTLAAGNTPSGVVVTDTNGDNHLDIVTSNSRSTDASVLLGDGRGHFATARTFVADGEPLVVAVGDLDGDGRPDVVTGNQATQGPDVAVLLNRSPGRLLGVEDILVGSTVSGMVAGDFDGDSLPDVAVTFGADAGSRARLYLARADGKFLAGSDVEVDSNPSAALAADFNRDGKLDLATVNGGTGSISMLLGHGDGTFDPQTIIPTTAHAVAGVIGDFDNNRIPDIALVSIGEPGSVTVMLGNGDGTLRSAGTMGVRNTPVAIVVGHFDGDAFADLAIANSGSDSVSVLLGNGNGTFHTGTVVPVGMNPVALATLDLNRDGFDDFAVATATGQRVEVYTGNGMGSFTIPMFPPAAGSTPSGIVARDFDGDGRPDIVVANQVSNDVTVLVNTQTGRLMRVGSVSISRQPKTIVAADFNADGRYDVATGNASTAMNVSALNNSGATPVLRGDGNGDGRVSAADLVAAQRQVTDSDSQRIEDVGRGTFAAAAGVDANGDGVVTPQDTFATARRIFVGS
jgi:hypothetical protein